MARISPDARSREILAWRRYGPVIYRIRQIFFMASTIAMACGLTLVYLTVSSFYPGTGSARPYGPTEKSVEATVEECREVGPVSRHGFGYWWVCHVVVTQNVGAEAVLDRSIAGPDDVGQVISLSEACFGEGRTDCRYGQPTAAVWPILVLVLKMLWRGFLLVVLLIVGIFLLKSILGAPRYFALVGRLRKSKGAS